MGRKGATGVVVLLVALALGLPGAGAKALDTTTVIVQVIGRGTVSGGGGQINCGDGSKSCYATYVSGTSVTLTVAPAAGWTFAGWDDSYDGCSGSSPSCTVPLDGTTHEEAAEFSPVTPVGTTKLTVTEPTGGTVAGGEIDCGGGSDDCEWEPITAGSTVTVVETPATGYSFGGWGGACSDTAPSCTVTMDVDRSVSATFTQSSTAHALTVSVTGNGTVTGGGIACTSAGGSGCSASEPAGSQVTLTATPGSGANFNGWGGACAGTSPTCTISMTDDRSVTAAFSGGGGATVPLTVSVTGSGKVTGSGIDCGNGGTTCSTSVATGSSVTLTAAPASEATFDGWGGACAGASSTCTLTMDAAKAVSARFTGTAPPTGSVTLTLRVSGNGVVIAPGGTCAGGGGTNSCAQSYAPGASVVLSARANPGARFVGWSGDCSGTTTTCTLALSAAKTVTASFTTASGTAPPAALRSLGRPLVDRQTSGFAVKLRFTTSQPGTARVRALRAGRVVVAFSFAVPAGPATLGPFRVSKAGYYMFEVALGARRIRWTACLGRCGAAAAARPFTVSREPARVVDAGAVWSVTVQFRITLPADVELRVYRGTTLALAYHFAPPAGRRSAGPFLLSPGTYTLRLTATDAFGRARTLTWFAFLP